MSKSMDQDHECGGAAVIPVRLIRSFQHRNSRGIVLRGVRVGETTVGDLLRRVREAARTDGDLPPPFRNFEYDAIKVRIIHFLDAILSLLSRA